MLLQVLGRQQVVVGVVRRDPVNAGRVVALEAGGGVNQGVARPRVAGDVVRLAAVTGPHDTFHNNNLSNHLVYRLSEILILAVSLMLLALALARLLALLLVVPDDPVQHLRRQLVVLLGRDESLLHGFLLIRGRHPLLL